MAKFNELERSKVYESAWKKWGTELQATVAIEEMSEVQKEICKVLRGRGNRENLAEEIADAKIMLEQISQIFNIKSSVETWVDYKIAKLERELEKK